MTAAVTHVLPLANHTQNTVVQDDDFYRLMTEADLFIGAGGGTSWERAAMGLPTICIAVSNVAAMPMACGKTVACPARATPCRASFHQS